MPKKPNKKVAKKVEDKPTRPRSAYNYFFQRTRQRLATEPDATMNAASTVTGSAIGREKFNRLGKRIGELWAIVAASERAELQKMADDDHKRYEAEMEAYIAKGGVGTLRKDGKGGRSVDVGSRGKKKAVKKSGANKSAKSTQRTMRPSLEDAIRLQPEEVLAEQLNGVQWVVVNGYSYYGPGLMEATVAAARRAGCKVAMHLASFEIVRKFREPMSKLLSSGEIHAVFGEFIFISNYMDN